MQFKLTMNKKYIDDDKDYWWSVCICTRDIYSCNAFSEKLKLLLLFILLFLHIFDASPHVK